MFVYMFGSKMLEVLVLEFHLCIEENIAGYDFSMASVCGNATEKTMATLLLPILRWLGVYWDIEQSATLACI